MSRENLDTVDFLFVIFFKINVTGIKHNLNKEFSYKTSKNFKCFKVCILAGMPPRKYQKRKLHVN